MCGGTADAGGAVLCLPAPDTGAVSSQLAAAVMTTPSGGLMGGKSSAPSEGSDASGLGACRLTLAVNWEYSMWENTRKTFPFAVWQNLGIF